MKVAIFGASGLVGSYLKDKFDCILAVRDLSKVKEGTFYWNAITGELDPKDIEGVDAVINLSGDNLASFYWTEGKKRELYESRIRSTMLISQTIQKMENPPKYLFNASAVGIYGNRGDELLIENSLPGKGFLASVAQKWEEAARGAEGKCKVVFMRFGVILSSQGGILNRLLFPFNLCLGGKWGNGKQWMSWISIEDIDGIIQHLYDKNLSGPINFVAPNPVTNADFTKIMSEVLKRPQILNVSSSVLRKIFGEFADEMILNSVRAVPEMLLQTGYQFKHPDLKTALQSLLR